MSEGILAIRGPACAHSQNTRRFHAELTRARKHSSRASQEWVPWMPCRSSPGTSWLRKWQVRSQASSSPLPEPSGEISQQVYPTAMVLLGFCITKCLAKLLDLLLNNCSAPACQADIMFSRLRSARYLCRHLLY